MGPAVSYGFLGLGVLWLVLFGIGSATLLWAPGANRTELCALVMAYGGLDLPGVAEPLGPRLVFALLNNEAMR